MNRSLVSLSLSSRITFYLLRVQRSGETTTTVQTERKRRTRENLLLLCSFRNDWFARTSSASKATKKEGGNERRKRGDRKAGVTSLETRSVKRDTRVANNRGAKRRGEERGMRRVEKGRIHLHLFDRGIKEKLQTLVFEFSDQFQTS